MKRVALLMCVLAIGGQAPSLARAEPQPPPAAEASASRYVAAIAEAFDVYEAEVKSAAALTFKCEAEAHAVMQTLSATRFDRALVQALASRGLSMGDLARYAAANQAFLPEQQKQHAGRFARLQAAVASFEQHVVLFDGRLASE